MTLVVNFVGAPSSGKTTLCSLLFGNLKIKGINVEYVPEFAKQLVWMQDFDLLNNQHYVTKKQYDLLKAMIGKVDVIVTDSSLANGLYYNRYNPHNTSNVEKTERHILGWLSEFNNLYVFVEKGDFPYEQAGRVENEEQSRHVQKVLKKMMSQHKLEHMVCRSSIDDLQRIIMAVDARIICKEIVQERV